MTATEWVEKRTKDGRRYLERRIDEETVERRFTDTEDRISTSHGGSVMIAEKRSSDPFELSSATAAPVMTGRFAVFNEWTEIRDRDGHYLERVSNQAFNRTIVEDRTNMRVLFNHGSDPTIGNKPLGPIKDLKVRSDGPHYEVPLFDTQYTRELIPGLQAGVYGASFRFRVKSDLFKSSPGVSAWNKEGLPERTLTDVQVLEFGPVTFPAYSGATAVVGESQDTGPISAPALHPPPRSSSTVDLAPIRMQTGSPVVTVKISKEALSAMERAAMWSSDYGRLETGGWLTGTNLGDVVHVQRATKSVRRQEPDSLSLDAGEIASIRMIESWGRDFGWIGCWHLHTNGDYRASDADFATWEAAHEIITKKRYEPYTISLILTHNETTGSVGHPSFHGWVTFTENGRLHTQRARIVQA